MLLVFSTLFYWLILDVILSFPSIWSHNNNAIVFIICVNVEKMATWVNLDKPFHHRKHFYMWWVEGYWFINSTLCTNSHSNMKSKPFNPIFLSKHLVCDQWFISVHDIKLKNYNENLSFRLHMKLAMSMLIVIFLVWQLY